MFVSIKGHILIQREIIDKLIVWQYFKVFKYTESLINKLAWNHPQIICMNISLVS